METMLRDPQWVDNRSVAEAVGAYFLPIVVAVLMALLALLLIFVIGGWKVFAKAGQPGWAVLVPVYNVYILLQIAGKPWWWLLLLTIPLVNIAIAMLVAIDLAKAFGQSAAFGVVLLFLLGGIGYLVLGFGKYRYLGPAPPVVSSI
jgi:hypothetical protein